MKGKIKVSISLIDAHEVRKILNLFQERGMKEFYVIVFCGLILPFIPSCGCDSMQVEGTAKILSVTVIDTLTECGGLAEVRFDFIPDDPSMTQETRLSMYQTTDVKWRVLYYEYPPKKWLDLVGVTEGSEQRCSFECYWGGGCGGWNWDFLDVSEESAIDSCEVWEGEE